MCAGTHTHVISVIRAGKTNQILCPQEVQFWSFIVIQPLEHPSVIVFISFPRLFRSTWYICVWTEQSEIMSRCRRGFESVQDSLENLTKTYVLEDSVSVVTMFFIIKNSLTRVAHKNKWVM